MFVSNLVDAVDLFLSTPDALYANNATFNRVSSDLVAPHNPLWEVLDAGVPTYEVVVQGGTHYEWSYIPTFPSTSWGARGAMRPVGATRWSSTTPWPGWTGG